MSRKINLPHTVETSKSVRHPASRHREVGQSQMIISAASLKVTFNNKELTGAL
jgi:hypothetical protein